jgi:hypothetical protein
LRRSICAPQLDERKSHMRKPFKSLALAAIVAAAAAAPAWADDNGMTAGYGDSWANLQAREPQAGPVPGLAEQNGPTSANAAWDDMRARAHRMREATSNAFHRMTGTGYTTGATTTAGTSVSEGTAVTTGHAASTSNPPDSQAAPAAYSGQGVAPGPAAVDAGAGVAGSVRSIPDRGGPASPSSSTNTVDPTGVGAATMGGSAYGGNQDPAKLPSQTGTQ